MLLQSAYRFYGKEELKPLIIQEIAGVPLYFLFFLKKKIPTKYLILFISKVIPNEVIDWFFDACKAKSINKVEKAVADIIKAGYSGTQLISQVSFISYFILFYFISIVFQTTHTFSSFSSSFSFFSFMIRFV